MGFMFATCDVDRAFAFINKTYPDRVDFTTEDLPLLADLIQKDVLRVQDPDFHKPAQIVLGKQADMDRDKDAIDAAIGQLMSALGITGTVPAR